MAEPTNAGMLGESSGLADTNRTMSEVKKCKVESTEFGETSGLADVVLIIEDTRIPVVKAVLSVASPVFRAMFTGEFAEKSQKEIELPDKNPESFVSFLRCIYPDKKVHVTDDRALSILPLASEYQVQNLIESCEECLVQFIRREIKSYPSINCDEICKYLKVAEVFGLEELKTLCIRRGSNFKLYKREAAIRGHKISAESEKAISIRACKRHELYEQNAKFVMTSKNVKELLANGCTSYSLPDMAYTKEMCLKLRLTYQVLGRSSPEYTKLVKEVKSHLDRSSEDFDMLPEDIIGDLSVQHV